MTELISLLARGFSEIHEELNAIGLGNDLEHLTANELDPDTEAYLDDRAETYGGDAQDMLDITPDHLDTSEEIQSFWENKHLSHIQSQANHPELANDWDNIIPEEPSSNISRGSDDMTFIEEQSAHLDNLLHGRFT